MLHLLTLLQVGHLAVRLVAILPLNKIVAEVALNATERGIVRYVTAVVLITAILVMEQNHVQFVMVEKNVQDVMVQEKLINFFYI